MAGRAITTGASVGTVKFFETIYKPDHDVPFPMADLVYKRRQQFDNEQTTRWLQQQRQQWQQNNNDNYLTGQRLVLFKLN